MGRSRKLSHDPTRWFTIRSWGSGLRLCSTVRILCESHHHGTERSFLRCILDAKLSKLSSSLVRSFVYSHDVVSRLSLGSVRDITSAASWLCDADERGNGEGYTGIFRRALMQKAGYGDIGSLDWVYFTCLYLHPHLILCSLQFLSIRKTLEANMQMDRLYPPGKVWWAASGNSDSPTYHPQATSTNTGCDIPENVRLYEVLDVEKVFGQVVFARDMLRYASKCMGVCVAGLH